MISAGSPTPDTTAVAYGLALRITGDELAACDSVVAAARTAGTALAPLVRAVREEARARRVASARESVSRPALLAPVRHEDWEVVERIALRGMTVAEAATDCGLERRETMLRLHRGLSVARDCLRETRDHAGSSWLERLRANLATGGLGDPARDRETQTAAGARVAA